MKTYLIVNAIPNPDHEADLKHYSEAVLPLLLEAGGESIKRAKLNSVVAGEVKYPLFLFMEFPDEQPILDLFESAAYQKLLPYRQKAFTEINIYTFTDL